MDLRFYFALFLRRLHWFLLFVVIGATAGVTIATVLPPTYIAQSVLIVESEQIPSELASSTVQTQATEALQIIQQRILTRDRLIEMANRMRIYQAGPDSERARMTGDDIVRDLRERISIVTTGASSRGPAQATIVTVSFAASTARLSADVTNEIVSMMLQENVALRTNVAGQTLEFFVEEVARLDRELAAQGAEILAFQEQNLNALPDSLDFRRSQQAAAQERLLQLEREQSVLRDRRARLVTLYEETGRVQPAAPEAQTQEERQLAALQDELSAALAVLSPTNPRIRLLESRIEALEAQIAAGGGGTPDTQGADPQLTAYEIQLADIDGQLAFLDEQREQIQATLDALQASIAATPANAIVLDSLQRDYSAVQAQYEQAVANRARAETGDTIEALSKGQRITVIESAVPPQEPDSPNRPLIAVAGLVGGIALGVGLLALIELLNTAIRRPVDITSKLGITPLGTLPFVRTPWETRRRRIILVTAFAVVLVGLPAALWYVHTEITPLDTMLNRVLDRLPFA